MRSRFLPLAFAGALIVAACGGSASSSDRRRSLPSGSDPTTTVEVRVGETFPDDRCRSNRSAGTITFLTGFDHAASSSALDVMVAEDAGYFDELCLDVEIVPSMASENYAAVAEGTAQFASGGSFSELVAADLDGSAGLVAATIEGRTTIDTLIVKAGEATELADLEGSTIGVKSALPPAIDVMLRSAGLVADDDYRLVEMVGRDPIRQLGDESVTGIPGWKSDEVVALERAGIGVALFDPLDVGVPGSFGVIFTSQDFVDLHPTAAQDFVRATMRGLADAVANPAAAASIAVDILQTGPNPMGLSPESEAFRWETEAALILDGTPEGLGLGIPDPDALQAEVDAYGAVDYFGSAVPDAAQHLAPDLVEGLYGDDEAVIWPG